MKSVNNTFPYPKKHALCKAKAEPRAGASRPKTRRLFCFVSLVILDVVCHYLSLFLLYINIEMGKK